MLLGTVFGTLSSNFLATPLVFLWNERQDNRLQQELQAKRKPKVEAAKPVGPGAGAGARG